jgi:hypothetical protein
LPRGLKHGYTIHNEGPVRFLVLSIPSDFGDHVESTGTRLSDADAKARFNSLLGQQTSVAG